MASRGRNTQYGQRMPTGARDMYVYNNTVRWVQEAPDIQNKEQQQHRVSRRAKKNRERAQSVTIAFILFLAVACIAVLLACVHFLQLKSQITRDIENIAALESEYSQLKADNDAYENQVDSSVDLNQVKEEAVKRLGMGYPSESQVVTYQMQRGSYVRQYQDVPDAE